MTIPGNINFGGDSSAAPNLNDFFSVTSAVDFSIVTDSANTERTWTFGADGTLSSPTNSSNPSIGVIQSDNGFPTLLAYGSGMHGGPELDWMNADNPANNFYSNIVLRNTLYINSLGVSIGMNENEVVGTFSGQWTFDNTGNLTLPGNTFAVNYANGIQVSVQGPTGTQGTTGAQGTQGTTGSQGTTGTQGVDGTQGTTGIGTQGTTGTQGTQGVQNYIVNGNSYANIDSVDGNLVISADSSTWTFDTAGNLATPGNVSLGGLLSAPQQTKLSNDPGTPGEICWDGNYIYVCVATDTWKQSPLNSY